MQTVFAKIAKLAKHHAELLNQPRFNLPLQRRCWHVAMTAAYFVKSNGHPRRFVAVKTWWGKKAEYNA